MPWPKSLIHERDMDGFQMMEEDGTKMVHRGCVAPKLADILEKIAEE